MRHLKHGLGPLALSIGVSFAMPATATQWLSSGAAGNAAQMTMTVGGQTVKVRAYSTQTPSSTSATASAGNFTNAQLMLYGGGFGITNNIIGDANEGVAPEHATDNNQIFDVLVFELPTAGFDLDAFRLGYATEAVFPSTTVTGEADISAFFGGNSLGADYNFSNACFSGCTGTNKALTGTGGLGFTDITAHVTRTDTNVLLGPAPDNNAPSGIDLAAPGNQGPGRYLVLTGALGGSNDNFKVDMLKATAIPVPEPGTIALLGLGLLGLVTLRRRPALA